ncbi:MAG: hypothetical protein JWQ45_3266 [Blastococcus sp.]|jgi:hypothetical protein|nr:hypothetical protein [Blastococcus sp.]
MDARSVLDARLLLARDDLRCAEEILTSPAVTGGGPTAALDSFADDLRLRALDLDAIARDVARNGDLRSGWGRLQGVRTDIEHSLRDSLAYLGALYVQQQRLDDDYGAVAGAVLGELAAAMPPQVSWPTVTLAVGDAFSPLTRTVWTRFPEFSVWALPMLGHEAGHVATQELRTLRQDARAFTFPLALLAGAARTGETTQGLGDRLNREFIADFFGVWSLGPAYACSAVLLRFSPGSADRIVAHHPPELERTHLILETLTCLDGGYADVVTALRRLWAELVTPFGLHAPEADETAPLDDLVADLARLAARLFPRAAFTSRTAVQELAGLLEQRARTPSEIAASYSLREIVNAAWIARLRHWDDETTVRRLEALAMAACRTAVAPPDTEEATDG